jgi:hypothetical protein
MVAICPSVTEILGPKDKKIQKKALKNPIQRIAFSHAPRVNSGTLVVPIERKSQVASKLKGFESKGLVVVENNAKYPHFLGFLPITRSLDKPLVELLGAYVTQQVIGLEHSFILK